jgi:hypothetical protein
MRNLLAFLLALLAFAVVHEGSHALTAHAFGEYDAFHLRPYGLEVTFKTPVADRAGFQWALISGTSNIVTIALGYLLVAARRSFAGSRRLLIRALGYWLAVMFLVFDPVNLAIGPLIYGGDAAGMAVGLGVSQWLVQGVFLAVFLVNRELLANRLLPAFGVRTRHPLFRPWLPVPVDRATP